MTARWRVIRHTDPRDFLAAAAPLIERDRAAYGGILAWARGLARTRIGRRSAALLATAHDPRGQAAAFALQRARGPLVIGDSDPAAAAAIASFLAGEGVELAGVMGTLPACDSFVRAWRRATGRLHRPRFHLRNYRLGELRLPDGVHGRGRPATEAELERIADWLDAFIDEVRVPDDKSQVRKTTLARIAEERLWVWADGGPRALLGFEMTGEDAARIVSVYTPPQHRGHGYAKALTAAVSRTLRERGCTDIFLTADVANLVSNGLYLSLGYVPVGDHYHFDFVPPEDD